MNNNIRKIGRKIGSKNLTSEQKVDLLRRKQSQRELRTLMKTRNYWTKESNRRYEDFHTPVITLKEGRIYSEYIFENSNNSKNVEDFLRRNKDRVIEKLKVNRKVNYTLLVTFYNPISKETIQVPFVKPFFILLTEKDFKNSYKELAEFFLQKISELEMKGSGWAIKHIDNLGVKLAVYNSPQGGCFRIELPAFLSNKDVFPILKTNDNECLKWAISYILGEGKRGEITDEIKEIADSLNWEKIEFPAEMKELIKFEKNNSSYLIYCYSYIGKQIGIYYKNKNFHELKDTKTVINILLYDNHFFPVMNENYLHAQIFSERKTFVCKSCLTAHTSQEKLEFHYRYCQKEFETRTVFPDPGETLKFKKEWAGEYVPYICYFDTEANLIPIEERRNKTEKYQKHELSYIGLLFVNCLTGETEYNIFENPYSFIKKLIYYSNLLKVRKLLVREEKIKADLAFDSATSCAKCNSNFTENNWKARDHCHFTGKFRNILCNYCNLKFKQVDFLPVFAHNLMGYDEKLIFKALGYANKILAKNSENFISIELVSHKIKFLDSRKFLDGSMAKISNNLLLKGKENFKLTLKEFPDEDLCLRKGVFPYDYITSDEVLNETKLPPKKDFYSKLYDEKISKEDYKHAQEVWEKFKIKDLREYLKLYLKLDCFLLADVFEQFRETIFEEYNLDPAHYITLPSLAMDCLLKYTGQELELISDPNIYNFIEKGIYGGICMSVQRFAEANNPYLESYDPSKETSYLVYNDKVNLYGKSMHEELPIGGFRFLENPEDWVNYEHSFVDIDIHLPEELHYDFKDYPLFPERIDGKLKCTFYPIKGRVCSAAYLRFALKKGYVLDKVSACPVFKTKTWMKSYVENNTRLRLKAKSKFEQNLWKLMSNGVYGKQIEDVRKRVDIILRNKYNVEKEFLKPTFENIKTIENLYLLEMSLNTIKLDKPIYGGLAILDFSKIIMGEFLIPKYGNNHKLVYTDTDSFISHIFTEDYYEDIIPDVESYFDTSEFPKRFKTLSGKDFPSGKNYKIPGLMGDELGANFMTRICALRSKNYIFETVNKEKNEKKCKGITKQAMKKITFKDYLKVLNNPKEKVYGKMNVIRSHDHKLYTETVNKKILDGSDDKR